MTMISQPSAALRPIKFTYAKLDDFTYDKFGRTVEGPAKSRPMKVARAKYSDAIEQDHALARAAQDELAAGAPPTATDINIAAFKRDMAPRLHIPAGAPLACIEDGRPSWADRAQDQVVGNIGDKVTARTEMSWRSTPVSVPIVDQYFGSLGSDGSFESAKIMADVRQNVVDASPRIAFERHGFKQVDGKVQEINGVDRYTLSLEEAANLARGLLLLVDLATATTDEIAGA